MAAAFEYAWDDMVRIALDGVDACWVDDGDKRELRRRVHTAAEGLAPTDV